MRVLRAPQVRTFGLSMMGLDVRQESTRHSEVVDAVTRYLGLGSYLEWDEVWAARRRRSGRKRGVQFGERQGGGAGGAVLEWDEVRSLAQGQGSGRGLPIRGGGPAVRRLLGC